MHIKFFQRVILSFLFLISSNNVIAQEATPNAVIETKLGNIELRFFPDVAPNHVENFLTLAKYGFYDGTIFHSIIALVIQSRSKSVGSIMLRPSRFQ